MRALVFLFMLFPLFVFPQTRQWSASEIKLKLKKLNFLGSVLYVAAHPDDENTRVIAYLANDRLAATAYLSMTRGDGGQNLIGPEIRDLLGLIRTQELLTARQIDGGEQFFTRAIDFGFSKNVAETFEIWNKEEVLSDVVRVVRQYQPDVLLTRFPADERAAGHGHHTASAVLAQEAFDVAALADRFPDQVNKWGTWQPKRIFTNTGRWWNQTIDENTPGIVTLNVGSYNTLLGKSYAEIAAESRTQHKSQGFGSPGRRGDALDFFEPVKGEGASGDIFDNVNVTWSRVKGGTKVQPLVEKVIHDFDAEKPYTSVPLLLQIRKAITQLEQGVWRERKLNEVNLLLQSCMGLYAEVTSDQYNIAPGEKVKLSFELVNRSKSSITLIAIQSQVLGFDSIANTNLGPNKLVTFRSLKTLSAEAGYSSPYWLKDEHSQGLFKVSNPDQIGTPENPPAVVISLVFEIEGEELMIPCPLIYKWTDPVKGELDRPFVIVPPVSVSLTSSIYIFKDPSPQQVNVLVKSASNEVVTVMLRLDVPNGWKVMPAQEKFDLNRRGSEKTVSFTVTAAQGETTSRLKAVASVNGKEFDQAIQTISYDHIPSQTLMPTAQAKVVRLNLKKEGTVVGYVKGAGDDIPAALRLIGYEVWEMKNEEVTADNLKKVDAVVLGIRALNTNERIRYFMPELLNFVQNGGTMIAQYNNNFDLEIDPDKFSPYPLALSRDRVTEENSEVRILKPDHPALNFPNKITADDFNGWVQERGLYFPGKWDPRFEALLSSNDKGELPRDGGLLVAKYGNGHYVYTGLSFFRELPEGVEGAYKLFANLVSLGKNSKPQNQKVKASRK